MKDKGLYPLCQPVVGSAELSVVSNHQSIELSSLDLCVKGVNGEHGCPSAGVDGTKADNATLNVLNEGNLDTSGESVVAGIDNASQVDELMYLNFGKWKFRILSLKLLTYRVALSKIYPFGGKFYKPYMSNPLSVVSNSTGKL